MSQTMRDQYGFRVLVGYPFGVVAIPSQVPNQYWNFRPSNAEPPNAKSPFGTKTCSNCFNSIFATVGVNNLAKFNIVWHHYNPSKVAKPCTMEMLAFNALRHVTCSAQNYAHIGDHWIMGQLSHVHCNRNLITIEFQINKKSMSKLYGWIVLKCPHVP